MEAIRDLQNKKAELLNQAMEFANNGDFKNAKAKREEAEELVKELQNAINEYENIKAMQDNDRVTNIQNKGVGPVVGTVIDNTTNNISDDLLNSIGYRKAFMNHIVRGEAIPYEFKNESGPTKTSDVGELIPTTVLEKIIEKLEATGMILPLVTRTSVKGGISIPTSNLNPVATWVAEGSGSNKQKKTTGTISFAYHKLRCAVSVTFETDLMALSVFESALINNITEAMTKALEQAIIDGDGSGKPKGILKETPNDGQSIESISKLEYETLIKAEAVLPLEYEAGAVHIMTKKTFMQYQGIVDGNGQPIARINYGIAGKPERTLLGRPVVLCNYLKSFDTANTGDVFHFIFNFKDYILNTNYNIGLKKYEDNDTDDLVTKAIMIVDGKVVVKDSLVVLKKA